MLKIFSRSHVSLLTSGHNLKELKQARQLVSPWLPYFSLSLFFFSFICLLNLSGFFLISFLLSFPFTFSHIFPLSFTCIFFKFISLRLICSLYSFSYSSTISSFITFFPVCIYLLHFAIPYFLMFSVGFITISYYSVSFFPFAL